MAESAVQAFARHLASLEESDRVRALAQAKMQAMNSAPEAAFEPPIRTLGQFLDDPVDVPPELVRPFVVVRGGICCTVGRAGKGKTVMNLNRLFKWSVGRPWFDGWEDREGNPFFAPTRPLRVLIVENEGAGGLFHRTVGIMLNAEGYLTKEEKALARDNILVWGDGGYSNLKLDDPRKVANVRVGLEKHQPDIIFVEPFRGLWSGEENSSTDMAVVVDNLVEMATDFNCGVMLAHHERKSGAGEDGEKMSAGRGSTVLEGVVVTMENFESVVGGKYRELSTSKSRYASDPPPPGPVRMEWDGPAWWYKHVDGEKIGRLILDALASSDEALNVASLAEITDETKTRLTAELKRLMDQDRVIRMASEYSGGGSTGFRYRLKGDTDNDDGGGLPI